MESECLRRVEVPSPGIRECSLALRRDGCSRFAADRVATATQLRDDGSTARAAHEVYRGSDLRRHASFAEFPLAIETLGFGNRDPREGSLGGLVPVEIDGIHVGKDQAQFGAEV